MTLQRYNRSVYAPQCMRGMTLVEVLVAIVILTFGLLGTVGLLATSMRTTNETANYVLASNLTRELVERIRVNRQAAQGLLKPSAYILDTQSAAPPATSPKNCISATVNCNEDDLAAWDLSEWWSRVNGGAGNGANAKGLPQPRVVICFDSAPTNSGDLQWACSAKAGAPLVVKIGWVSRNSKGEQDTGTVFDVIKAPRVVVLAAPGPGI